LAQTACAASGGVFKAGRVIPLGVKLGRGLQSVLGAKLDAETAPFATIPNDTDRA